MFKRTEGVSTTDSSKSPATRDRTYSSEKPMRTSEYLSEAKRKGQEDLMNERKNLNLVNLGDDLLNPLKGT